RRGPRSIRTRAAVKATSASRSATSRPRSATRARGCWRKPSSPRASPMPRLAGKVALISGGARGMGAAEAKLFAQEGAAVVIGDVLDAEGRALAADLAAKGHDVAFVHLDVTRESDWQQAVELTVSRFGKLNVLVNNAGIGGPGRIEDVTVEAWDE